MSGNLKISIGLVAVLVASVIGIAILTGSSDDEQPAPAAVPQQDTTQTPTVRADSHRLSTARDGRVTLVEFLDFECEACGALFPVIEQLREEYEGRVTFVVRYFPLPGHANGQIAAQAVEAAARQGQFEAMYKRMFETQSQWGEARESKESTFVGFARDLGLEMARFMRDLKAPATVARVTRDMRDGTDLGVEATPTLFLNDERIELESVEQLKADIDAALAQ